MKARKTFKMPRVALVLLVALVSTSAIVTAQTPAPSSRANQAEARDEVVRVDSNLVTIPATVMDREGRYITDLKKEDFQIFEDGIEQEVAFFAPVEQSFTIFLVLDLSSSMISHKENLARAVNGFVGLLHPNDQLITAKFFQNETSLDTLIPATRASELHKAIKLKFREDADCYTLIYDVVDDALKRIQKVHGRKAIVLLSDGEGIGLFATAKSTLHKAEEQDALIYTVQFGTDHGEPRGGVPREVYYRRIEETNAYMRDLAKKTGGRYYQVETMTNTEPFGQVVDELGHQYSLGYYPKIKPEAGQQRRIRVRVSMPDVVVRARDSYIVDKVLAQGK
jgi:Ca-activated chloride channel family protein